MEASEERTMYTSYFFDQIIHTIQWIVASVLDFFYFDRELDYYEEDRGCCGLFIW
jgi:hypothetical protein